MKKNCRKTFCETKDRVDQQRGNSFISATKTTGRNDRNKNKLWREMLETVFYKLITVKTLNLRVYNHNLSFCDQFL